MSLTPSVVASSSIVPASSAPVVVGGRAVPFERIGRAPPRGLSPISGRTAGGPTVVVATSAEETSALLANERLATNVAGLPPIGDGAYLAAFAGLKASSGYDIAVTDVRAEPEGVTLWARQSKPAAGDGVLPTVTYPVDVIRIANSEIAIGSTVTVNTVNDAPTLSATALSSSLPAPAWRRIARHRHARRAARAHRAAKRRARDPHRVATAARLDRRRRRRSTTAGMVLPTPPACAASLARRSLVAVPTVLAEGRSSGSH